MWSFGVTIMHLICFFLDIPRTPMKECINHFKQSTIVAKNASKEATSVSKLAEIKGWNEINNFWKTCKTCKWKGEKSFQCLLLLVENCLRIAPEHRITPAAAIAIFNDVNSPVFGEPDWVKNLDS